MKACVYDWALHTIGGGQKTSCKIAEQLSKNEDLEVDLLTLFAVNKKQLEKFYDADLSKVKLRYLYPFVNRSIGSRLHLLSPRRISKISKEYDIFFNSQGHEKVKPLAKHNILFCHFPELDWYRKPRNFFDGIQLVIAFIIKKYQKNHSSEYAMVYSNSEYSVKWVNKLWKVDAKRLYLPINTKRERVKKENLIVSSGRLTPDKQYEFMIDCFKDICDGGIKNYKYVICGLIENKDYEKKLLERAKGYPIEIYQNRTDKEMRQIYAKARILFHSKGFGMDEEKQPQEFEHFGMVTPEAMAQGCVPVVFNGGGQREIVENGKNGFLFDTKEECIKSISRLIENLKLWEAMSKSAQKRAACFSLEKFRKEIDNIIYLFSRMDEDRMVLLSKEFPLFKE